MKTGKDIFLKSILILWEGMSYLGRILFPEKRKTEYDADFLDVTKCLSIFNKGFVLDGRHSETIHDSLKNCIVFGSTGNFKSAGIAIPTILRAHKFASLVINDPPHELRIKCAQALKNDRVDVKVINWSDPSVSEAYNPLKRVISNTDNLKISKLLIRAALGEGGRDPFWNVAAENICSFGIRFIKTYTDPQYHTLANVYHFVSRMLYAPEVIERKLIATQDAALLSEYKAFVSYGKTLDSVIATCRTALAIFALDPAVARVTSHDTINFSECKRKRTAIFINTSVHDQKYYSIVTSLFLEQFFSELMSELPTKHQIPVFFVLEEASSLFFSMLPITLANCRKHLVSILQIYQSKGQLIDLYGVPSSRSILENSYAHVYMSGQSIQVASELESVLGRFEYLDDKKVRHVRPLLTANEIHELEESIILLGNHRPIKVKPVPYFKQFRLRQLTSLPPYRHEGKVPDFAPLIKYEE